MKLFQNLSLSVAAMAALTCSSLAQGFGGGDIGGGLSGAGLDSSSIEAAKDLAKDSRVRAAISNVTAAQIKQIAAVVTQSVADGGNFCERLGAELRIDCLAESYEVTARRLSNVGPEAELKKAFNDAARKLRRVVSNNADRGASKVLPTVRTRKIDRKASRPMRKIDPAKMKRAKEQAEKIISELSTVILRSSDKSKLYARMARSVNSNKVLLRS